MSKPSALEPWNLSSREKERIFIEAKQTKRKIALYYSEQPDSSTFRYRCYNTFQTTQNSKKWQAIYFYANEIEILKRLLPKSDLFIFSRQSRWNPLVQELILLARQNNLKIILDIDDLVFDQKYLSTMLNTTGEQNPEYWLPYFSDMHKTAQHADGFYVTNDYLGNLISSCFDKPHKTIRNSLNTEQIEASTAYLLTKANNNKKFIIGYFSGSPTHAHDLNVALPEVLDFLKKHENTILRVVGYMRFNKNAQAFLENQQIQFIPPTDFRRLQKLTMEVDVNIAPLVINEFTNCKSELKFFESAIAETTTIASPTYTFRKAISDGKNGFLAQQGEWYQKIEFLYQNPAKNQQIAMAAKEYALKHYYGREFLREIEEAYDYFAK